MAKAKYEYKTNVKKFNTIQEMVRLAAEEAGDKAGFRFRENGEIRDVTYTEFRNTTLYIGTALYDMGLVDKHIAMVGENSYNWICVYLTVLQSNGVYVPVDKELSTEQMKFVLTESDSNVLFYTKRFEDFVQENKENLPNITTYIAIDGEEDTETALSFSKLIEKGKALYEAGERGYETIKGDSDTMRMLVYTSGTTGIAKGVMLSEHNLVSSVYYGLQVSSIYERGLSVLPYHHTYEAVPGILVSIHNHSTLCINENLKTVLKNMSVYKPEHIYLVPAFVEVFYKRIWSTAKSSGKETGLKILIKVSNALRKVGIDLRRKLFASVHSAFGGELKKIVCGGAPLRRELGEFFDAIGISLTNGYGITECSPLVSVNHDTFNDCTTVGMPLPCLELRIDQPAEDGSGEICVKGDVVMLGYYKQPELTKEVLGEDGWFKTGDYGKITEFGQLAIVGRKKNIIILDNGKNIFPEEIEECMMGVPYIKEVVVYGVKNEEGIETKLACQVFLDQEKIEELAIENPEEQVKKDIAEVCNTLVPYKRVNHIVIRDEEFEKNSSNKIKRNVIDTTLC